VTPAAQHSHWIVLLAHGSRDAGWRRPLERLREEVARLAPDRGVVLAYLQLAEPDLEGALRACAHGGGRTALVVPVFLSGGGHILRDVPRAVQQAAVEVGTMQVRCAGALGEEPEVLAGMAAACARLAAAPD